MTPAIRNILLILAVVLVGSISYYFAIALPTHNRRMLEFEREKYEREEAARAQQAESAQADTWYREQMLQTCTARAEKDYWETIKGNSKPAPGKPGYLSTPTHVLDSAQKRKADALAECHRQYGARQ